MSLSTPHSHPEILGSLKIYLVSPTDIVTLIFIQFFKWYSVQNECLRNVLHMPGSAEIVHVICMHTFNWVRFWWKRVWKSCFWQQRQSWFVPSCLEPELKNMLHIPSILCDHHHPVPQTCWNTMITNKNKSCRRMKETLWDEDIRHRYLQALHTHARAHDTSTYCSKWHLHANHATMTHQIGSYVQKAWQSAF